MSAFVFDDVLAVVVGSGVKRGSIMFCIRSLENFVDVSGDDLDVILRSFFHFGNRDVLCIFFSDSILVVCEELY